MKKKFILILLFYSLIIYCTNSFNAPFDFEQIHYENIELKDFQFSDCKSGRIFDSKQDCIIIRDKDMFNFYQIESDSLRLISQLSHSSRKWTINDFNGNGRDEIIICLGTKIIKYEWNDKQFNKTSYDLTYRINDFLSGDITNDGIEDLVLSCLPASFNKKSRKQFQLVIVNFLNNQIEIIHESKVVQIYFDPHIPSDKLICIADIENDDRYQLVISNSESCVPSFNYKRYLWNSDLMEFHKVLKRVPSKCNKEEGFVYFEGMLHPFKFYDNIYIYVNQGGNTKNKFIIMSNQRNKWLFYPIDFGSSKVAFASSFYNDFIYYFILDAKFTKKRPIQTKPFYRLFKIKRK